MSLSSEHSVASFDMPSRPPSEDTTDSFQTKQERSNIVLHDLDEAVEKLQQEVDDMALRPVVDYERPQETNVEQLQTDVLSLLEAMALESLGLVSSDHLRKMKQEVRIKLRQCPTASHAHPNPYLSQVYGILQHTLTSYWTCVGWTVKQVAQEMQQLEDTFVDIQSQHDASIRSLRNALAEKCAEFTPSWQKFVSNYVSHHPEIKDGTAWQTFVEYPQTQAEPWTHVALFEELVVEDKWKSIWAKFKELSDQCHTLADELSQVERNIIESVRWDKETSRSRVLTNARNKIQGCKGLFLEKERHALANLQQQWPNTHNISGQTAQAALANHCDRVNSILQSSFLSVHPLSVSQ